MKSGARRDRRTQEEAEGDRNLQNKDEERGDCSVTAVADKRSSTAERRSDQNSRA